MIATCGSVAYLVISLDFGRLIGNMTDVRVLMFAAISLGLIGFGLRDVMAVKALSLIHISEPTRPY